MSQRRLREWPGCGRARGPVTAARLPHRWPPERRLTPRPREGTSRARARERDEPRPPGEGDQPRHRLRGAPTATNRASCGSGMAFTASPASAARVGRHPPHRPAPAAHRNQPHQLRGTAPAASPASAVGLGWRPPHQPHQPTTAPTASAARPPTASAARPNRPPPASTGAQNVRKPGTRGSRVPGRRTLSGGV